MLCGGAFDGGLERADLSATLDVSSLLRDSPIGVDRFGEKRPDVSIPLSLVAAREP